MLTKIDISNLIQTHFSTPIPLIDVRSPGEFHKGHIPGAHNIPIFNDEERKAVGILYKQKGREKAMEKGLEFVGPKMADFVRKAKELSLDQKIRVHCWRGGMRSESMGKLWSMAGLNVEVLTGGYKAYRTRLHQDFGKPYELIVLGGKTGSGKTDILKELGKNGEQIIDLEGIAHHKGSTFGSLGQEKQPTVEQFENDLHAALIQLDSKRKIWIENESHSIGQVYIPMPFFNQMQKARTICVELPLELRVDRLVREYAQFDPALLTEALERIRKRLGGQNMKDAFQALEEENFTLGAEIALKYYDKTYNYGLKKRKNNPIHSLVIEEDHPEKTAIKLIHYCQQLISS